LVEQLLFSFTNQRFIENWVSLFLFYNFLIHFYDLQLGAGTSLPGLVAAKVGADVTLTDIAHNTEVSKLKPILARPKMQLMSSYSVADL
jgi:hypothetical protein